MISRLDLNHIRSALLKIPGVTGVGYGLKETLRKFTRDTTLRVYVAKKKTKDQLGRQERIPARLDSIETDVIERAEASASAGSATRADLPGIRIANSKGVPGTMGCLATTLHSKQPVLLSSCHVLYANGAGEGDEVWQVDEAESGRKYSRIGTTLYGKLGTVHFEGEEVYLDCAVASYLPSMQNCHGSLPFIDGQADVQPGDAVMKTGAATGVSRGVVIDNQYFDYARIAGRPHPSPGQILVQPDLYPTPFSAEGDSGAVIINAAGKAVALLWGTNSRGQGVACPIAPVLHALNLSLHAPHNL